MRACSAISQDPKWEQALDQVLSETDDIYRTGEVALAILFASAEFADDLERLVARTRSATGANVLIGCSGQGIIGTERETEGAPAVSLLLVNAPGAQLYPTRVSQADIEAAEAADRGLVLDMPADDLNGILLFADPFTIDPEGLIQRLNKSYPNTPIVGGLASGAVAARQTYLFYNNLVFTTGAVILGLGGTLDVRTVVSQGATPIGEPWTITGTQGHIIETIAQRPAYEVLVETFQTLPSETQHRAQRNLLAGLAIDEYKDSFSRGDFLIRNLTGADPKTGRVAIGAHPHVGQTIQFQLRDAAAADEDLRLMLEAAVTDLDGASPIAGILCSCNGRGVGLFGTPHHDAAAVASQFGKLPLAGFFCNGEIGPVGKKPFLHGYTASIALLVERSQ